MKRDEIKVEKRRSNVNIFESYELGIRLWKEPKTALKMRLVQNEGVSATYDIRVSICLATTKEFLVIQ